MGNMISGIIGITLGIVVLSGVFISTVKATNTSGACTQIAGTAGYTCSPLVNATMVGAWSTGEIALWGMLSLCGIAGLVYGVLSIFGLA